MAGPHEEVVGGHALVVCSRHFDIEFPFPPLKIRPWSFESILSAYMDAPDNYQKSSIFCFVFERQCERPCCLPWTEHSCPWYPPTFARLASPSYMYTQGDT